MFELLEAPGVTYEHSRPYHPQTCGKVERFHQTLKRWLARQPEAAALAELQVHLDRFVATYNDARPHRSLGRRTPREVFDAKLKARPVAGVPDARFRVRRDRVDKTSCVTLRYQSRLRHIGIGRAHKGRRVLLLIADGDVRVVSDEGELLRQLVIDPSRDYQRRGTT